MENKDSVVNIGLIFGVVAFVIFIIYIMDLHSRTGHGLF